VASEPRKLIAIDPGDRYVGVAFFTEDPDEEHGWYCADAQEFDPREFEDGFAESIVNNEYDYVVIERFRLYKDKAMLQTGSEFETSQLIGALKFIVRKHNEHAARHANADTTEGRILKCELPGGVCNNPPWTPKPVTLLLQMADIKKPTTAILRRKGIKSVAGPISKSDYKGRDHVKDAELHGWKAILDGGVK
jgi:hypothetical protein